MPTNDPDPSDIWIQIRIKHEFWKRSECAFDQRIKSPENIEPNFYKRNELKKGGIIVLILDGNLEIGVHAKSNICYLIF